ncbi:MAG TPA: hypothetical protein PK054_08015 [Anaerohalosphaeraceae bacterium]|nr:hypothetical protein [Anaerohalosphaeraceae bacterium]HOL88492.1 hypothetical protein [Anaerohalosphaeraceae bacterium]HPP56514.1 hypothetical protein [Anaerohalosphaeraceae bacterium]
MNGMRLFTILFWTVIGVLSSAAAGGAEDPNAPGRTAELRRQIQEEQIQPVYLSMTSVSTVDLESLIAGLEQLKIPVQTKKPVSEANPSASEPPSKTSSEGTVKAPASAEQTEKPASGQPKPAEAEKTVKPKWLDQIDQIEQPIEPLGIADALFRCGQLDRAERFYRLASEQVDAPSEPDWQWAVFQRANCLRYIQPGQAAQLYEELLQKAPGSRWSGAAKASLETLRWVETLQTASSLKGLVREPNSLSQ